MSAEHNVYTCKEFATYVTKIVANSFQKHSASTVMQGSEI